MSWPTEFWMTAAVCDQDIGYLCCALMLLFLIFSRSVELLCIVWTPDEIVVTMKKSII